MDAGTSYLWLFQPHLVLACLLIFTTGGMLVYMCKQHVKICKRVSGFKHKNSPLT